MILSRAHILLKDDRSDLRVKENGRIPWQIKYKQREGMARIRNISVSGMLIETDTTFNPKDECIFSFDSDRDAGLFIPQRGRLVWHKKKKFSRKKYLSGIKFLEADDQILISMRARVQQGVESFVRKRKMTNTTGLILCVAFIGIMGYTAWYSSGIYRDMRTANQRLLGISGQQPLINQSYRNLYRANEADLAEITEKLNIANQLIQEDKAAIALFTQELEATKALLNQTEAMLIQANDRNAQLQANQRTNPADGQNPIWAAGTMTLDGARSLIKSIKGEIKRLRGEERAARVENMSRIDEQKLTLGNNGYFVQEGKVIQVDEKQFQSLTASQLRSSGTPENKDVEIDVTFFE